MPVKSLPQSSEAESGLLGSCLIDNSIIGDLVQNITPDHFFSPANKAIYEEAVKLWEEGQKFDLITFTQTLNDKHVLDKVGGVSYVTSLFTSVPNGSNAEYYKEILRDKYLLRKIISYCSIAESKAYNTQDDVEGLLAEVQSKILALSDTKSKEAPTMHELAMEAVDEFEKSYNEKGKIPGLTTGLIDLDRQLGGMRPTQLITIAADTGIGKTSLGLGIVEHLSINMKVPCGIVSLEMSALELTQRLIGSVGRIDLHKFAVFGGVESDFPKITQAVDKVSKAPIFIRDDSDVDAMKLRGIARTLKHEHNVGLILVDYVQLLTPQGTEDENRERAMSRAAQALKQMAKELKIVVVVLSQVNEHGKLRESRAIGHHSDAVMTIRHDEDEPGLSHININKNRSGPIGSVSVTFLKHFSRFENRAHT